MERTPSPVSPDSRYVSVNPRAGGGVRASVAAFLVLPLLSLSACATKGDIRDLQQEVRNLHQRQQVLMEELQMEQRAHRDSVRALSGQIGEHRIQMSRTLREMEDQLIRIQELAGLSQQELAGLRDQMDRRPDPLAGFRDPGTGMEAGGEAQEIYDAAMTQYRRGSMTSAQFGLEEVVDRFPSHQLTPSARYYLADIMVQRDELREAIEAFLEIPQYHPDAERVPYALYRVGLLYQELGETAEARSFLERVVNTWPDSGAADMARRALNELS
jgi:TolA-binding protein